MKIALFKYVNVNHEFECIFEKDEYVENDTDRIRVTHYLDVEFERLPQSETVNIELEAITRMESKVRAECQVKLNELEGRRQSLLSITHDHAE